MLNRCPTTRGGLLLEIDYETKCKHSGLELSLPNC
jgi:hypothetical protein